MAQTTIINNTVFIHRGDMSGDVTIKNKEGSLDVEADYIVEFILDYIKGEKIGKLNDMNSSDFMNTLTR